MLAQLRAFALLPLVALGACSGTEPSTALLPEGAQVMAAPAEYATWFARTEGCSELSGRFGSLKFYVVPGVRSFQSEYGETVALWRKVGNDNLIILSGEYVGHEMVVRHEMLHALLAREGHPTDYFAAKCRLTWETWDATAGVLAMHEHAPLF